jgi:hypothetical protein
MSHKCIDVLGTFNVDVELQSFSRPYDLSGFVEFYFRMRRRKVKLPTDQRDVVKS